MSGPNDPGGNPLVHHLPAWRSQEELIRQLYFDPLEGRLSESSSVEQRMRLLGEYKAAFVPTAMAVDLAYMLQMEIHQAMDARDPRVSDKILELNKIALSAGEPIAKEASAFHAAGGAMLRGDTGLGKSATLAAVSRVIFPIHLVDYGSTLERYGIARLVHVYFLRIDLNSKGSTWTLATAITGALDKLLGTNYTARVGRARNHEIAIADVLRILLQHHVAVLILDELQDKTLQIANQAIDVLEFFRHLMNHGVAVILSGHPKAFTLVESNTQLMRRFSMIGDYEFFRGLPTASPSDKDPSSEWDQFTEAMMWFRVVDAVEDESTVRANLSELSGGSNGIFTVLWIEAQRIALSRKSSPSAVTVKDAQKAATTPRGKVAKRLGTAFRLGGLEASKYDDITPDPRITGVKAGHQVQDPVIPQGKETPDSIKAMIAASERGRKAKEKKAKAKETVADLDADDLRRALKEELDADLVGLAPQGALKF